MAECKHWWNHKYRIVEILRSNGEMALVLAVCRRCGKRKTGML
jgi:hypothetical protein